jgi:hypothetical protein
VEKDYLVKAANSDPNTFWTLLGKLVPAQVRAELDNGGGPLMNMIVRLRSAVGGLPHQDRREPDIMFGRDDKCGHRQIRQLFPS